MPRILHRMLVVALSACVALPGYSQGLGQSVKQQEPSGGVPTVVLSYPARITPRAKTAVETAFSSRDLGQSCDSWIGNLCSPNPDALNASLTKTFYYVLDVYEAMQSRLPVGAVVVQPATLDVDSKGNIVYVIPNTELPAVARVDFVAYVKPNSWNGGPSGESTHGRHFAPVFVAKTSQIARPGSRGYITATKGLDVQAAGSVQPSVLLQILASSQASPVKITGKGFVTTKFKWDKMPDPIWSQHMLSPTGEGTFVQPMLTAQLQPIIDFVMKSDHSAVFKEGIAAYREIYARELEGTGESGERLLLAFIKGERDFTNKVTIDLLREMRRGDFGSSMRQRLLAEKQFNDKAQKSAFMAGMAMSLGGLAGMASGTLIGPQMLAQAQQKQVLDGQMFEAYDATFSDVSSRQFNVVIDSADGQRPVQARTLAELRAGFKTILLSVR